MKRRTLGSTGLEVTALCIGTSPLAGMPQSYGYDVGEDRALVDLTAREVHVLVDLPSGYYELTNAGHPPALLWSTPEGAWVTDRARGTALGILRRSPYELRRSPV